MATAILKKLTAATFVGNKDELLKIAKTGAAKIPDPENDGEFILAPVGKKVPIMTVLGHVTNIKPGVHKETGTEFVKMFGNFKAVNLITGEIQPDVNLCLLPNFVATAIAAVFVDNPESPPVDFGVTLLVKYSAKSAVGYEYEAESLMAPQTSSPIQALEAQLIAAGVALPAPTKLALPTPEPTPEPTPAPKGKKK